jgi:hypothetical protein
MRNERKKEIISSRVKLAHSEILSQFIAVHPRNEQYEYRFMKSVTATSFHMLPKSSNNITFNHSILNYILLSQCKYS